MSTRSPTSYGCLTKRKMQEPRNSWVVTAKTKDSERSVVPAVVRVAMKLLWKTATVTRLDLYLVRSRRKLTEDDDDNDQDHKEEDLIKHPQCLADILHA